MRKILNFASEHCSGVVLWLLLAICYGIMIAYMLMPLDMITSNASSLLRTILSLIFLVIVFASPTLASIINLILWFVSIPFALNAPFDRFMIIYLICAALYTIFEFIPYILRTILFFMSNKQ